MYHYHVVQTLELVLKKGVPTKDETQRQVYRLHAVFYLINGPVMLFICFFFLPISLMNLANSILGETWIYKFHFSIFQQF